MNRPLRKPAPAQETPLQSRLRRGLDLVEALPTLPEVITQILALVDDPMVSAHRIAEVVGRDQAMVATILRLVNSPFYGLRGRITSIQHAVVLLGLRTVRNMALSSVLVKTFGVSSADQRFNRALLWRHTVACAVGARLLSQELRTIDPEEAFLAGLLHDMGMVILDQYFHPDFRRVLDRVVGQGQGLLEAEQEVLSSDHAAMGAILARRWNFPAPVIEAIARHHRPDLAEKSPQLTALVHLAHALQANPEEDRPRQIWEDLPLDPNAYTQAGITPEGFARMQEAFQTEWERAQGFLRLSS
jgi:putative nucleotidyltransferase with HDIG domain